MQFQPSSIQNSRELARNFNNLSRESLIIILEDSLRQQQQLKVQLLIQKQSSDNLQEQVQLLRSKVSSQNDTTMMMMYAQQRNIDKIDEMEKALVRFGQKHHLPLSSKDNNYETKYKQLKRHLELYMKNSNQVQEELLDVCRKNKRQTAGVYKQYERAIYLSEELRLRCDALEITLDNRIQEMTQYKRSEESKKKAITKQKQEQKQNQKSNIIHKSQKEEGKLQDDMRSLQFRFNGLSKERNILQSQVDDLKQLNQQIKHENHLLKETIRKLEDYNKGLLDRLIQPSSSRESVSGRDLIDTWSIEVKRLKKQLDQLNQKLAQVHHENKLILTSKNLLQQKLKIIQTSNAQLLKQNLSLSSQMRLFAIRDTSTIKIVEQGKSYETEGESTIVQSVQMNLGDPNRRVKNFLSHKVSNLQSSRV